jgi:hypothetical protein
VTAEAGDDRFRTAARAYFVYGLVYWLGGVWLAWQGIGVRAGGTIVWAGLGWLVAGLVFVVLVPFLLRRRRHGFERWVVSRRDFARILALFMAFRAWKVLQIALRDETPSVPAPWGGTVSFRAGAVVFFLVTVVASACIARAAWAEDGG